MGVVVVPREYFGRTFDEGAIKEGLRALCPDIHFDMGAALNIEHPYIANRQGVFHKGRYICAMDRGGSIPETTLWSLKEKWVTVPAAEVRPGEIAMYNYHNGAASVWRKAPDIVLMLGWRHVFQCVAGHGIPGVTKQTLAAKFSVNMDVEQEIDDHVLEKWDACRAQEVEAPSLSGG